MTSPEVDLGAPLLDAAIGSPGSATTLVKDGETQIVYTPYSNTLSCARCIKSSNIFVYNYEVKQAPPDLTDYSEPPEEPEPCEEGDEDCVEPEPVEEVEEEEEGPPIPFYYHDMADDEESLGWCCEKAGADGLLCGTRNINGQNIELVPDDATPKSSDFSSDDLAINACW